MSKIYLYSTDSISPGVNKILINLNQKLKSKGITSEIIYSFEFLNKDEIIIPYGIKAAYDLHYNGYKIDYCLMVDAYTLGWVKKILFYIKKLKLHYFDLYYSLYQVLKYSYKEIIVLNHTQTIMYVSSYDIKFISRFFRHKRFILVPNGVDLQNKVFNFRNWNCSKSITLGTISNWNKTSINEVSWFIEDYFPKLKKKFPNLNILVAGIDKFSVAKKYFSEMEGIKYIGEIKNLEDFFLKIDIFISTVPKGVGILNKVLDAFAFNKFVIGLPECFYAFPDNKKGYVSCKNIKEFEAALNFYLNEKDKVSEMLDYSYQYVKHNHSWQNNYLKLVEDLISFYGL